MAEFRALYRQLWRHSRGISHLFNILRENRIRLSGEFSQLERGHSQLDRSIRNNGGVFATRREGRWRPPVAGYEKGSRARRPDYPFTWSAAGSAAPESVSRAVSRALSERT